jgi:Glycogen debranching enzyme N terminal
MITIRSLENISEVAVVRLEATLMMPRSTYTISSNSPLIDSALPLTGGLFGAISWPHWHFRLPEGLLLEQQMFLPHDGSTVALSWALRGEVDTSAQLVVRPFFSGCGPRSYRDVGFRFDSEEDGGRLTWLPNVRGPKVIADTNGRYQDEPARSFDCLCRQATASASSEDLITPGSFEFELGPRPSVLIISLEGDANAQRNQHVGAFLAGLMQNNSPARTRLPTAESVGTRTQQLAVT